MAEERKQESTCSDTSDMLTSCLHDDESINGCDNSIDLNEELMKCISALKDLEQCTSGMQDNNDSYVDGFNLASQISSSSSTTNSNLQNKFYIDKDCIPQTQMEDDDQELTGLGVNAYDQTEFEIEVMGQVDKALKREEEIRRQEQVAKELKSVSDDIETTKQRLNHLEKVLDPSDTTFRTPSSVMNMRKEQENKLKQLKKLEAKHRTLTACATNNKDELQELNDDSKNVDDSTCYHVEQVLSSSKETEEERLIRTGQMTPFGTVLPNQLQAKEQTQQPKKIIHPQSQPLTEFDKFLLSQSSIAESRKPTKFASKPPGRNSSQQGFQTPSTSKKHPKSHEVSKLGPGFSSSSSSVPSAVPKNLERSKMKVGHKLATGIKKNVQKSSPNAGDLETSGFVKDDDVDDVCQESGDEYVPDGKESDYSEDELIDEGQKGKKRKRQNKEEAEDGKLKKSAKKTKKVVDDGCQKAYLKRIKMFEKEKLKEKHRKILESEDGIVDSDDEEYIEFDEFKVPSSLWEKLYRYQQTGVRWLWELHQQNCGGIMGDEMGLGKTIQMIVFLVGLKVSNLHIDGDSFQGLGPVILVCPTTVMHQWVKEFHKWWPPIRVAVLHESGSYSGKKKDLIQMINSKHGVLVTSYNGLVQHQESLLNHDWHYIILDEGHKIRNPDAQATLAAKQFRTAHRIILSGSPIQNNLKELWSLFDFIFPGKLGTLPVFMQQFSVPIVLGGYANATQVQVQTAYKCATVLRDAIKPYLLRRMKADVKSSIQLPNKSEQVLFCQLSDEQKDLYKTYLASPQIESIIKGRLQVFVGLINLRKICNHPDLYTGGPKIFKDTDLSTLEEDMHYGFFKRSGKMIVVRALLRLWHKQGHRVLLFTQSRQMMEILEIFINKCGYTYMKMDGSTAISARQPAVAKFNSDPSIFVFILTTRVGGLGVNLTAADRVIIYDPDWNPSTDAQAKERSWRIGQDKQVTIYRLLTAGTIEEKIYHRQIFKQFVTNRVLKDPRQRRFFKSNDLYELFTYTDANGETTETSAIFAGTGSEIKPVKKPKHSNAKSDKHPKTSLSKDSKDKDVSVTFSSEKIEKMKELAKKISMQLLKGPPSGQNSCHSSTSKDSSNLSEVASSSSSPCNIGKNSKVSKDRDIKGKRKMKSTVVEGKKIENLVKKDLYKNPIEEEKNPSNADDYVLSKLFKKSGVHTALKHDVIVNSSDPDYLLVEGEANKVAQDAIKALKQSRRLCARAVDGIPTWTGTNGGVRPKFGLKKKLPPASKTSSPGSSSNNPSPAEPTPSSSGFTPKKSSPEAVFDGSIPSTSTIATTSSSDLLAAIRKRKEAFGDEPDHEADDSDSSSDNDRGQVAARRTTEHDELLDEIRNFIAFRAAVDGQARTEEILHEFRDRLPRDQTAVFKALLGKICDFSRTSNGDGIWYLKEEFR